METNNIILLAGMPEIHQKLQNVLRTKNLSYGEHEDICLAMAQRYKYPKLSMNISVNKMDNNITTHRELSVSTYSSKIRKLPRYGLWKMFPDKAFSCQWEGKFVMMPVLTLEDMDLYIKEGPMTKEGMMAFWSNKDSFEQYDTGKNFNYFVPELSFEMRQQDIFQKLSKRAEHNIQSSMSLRFDVKLLKEKVYINRDRITLFKEITFALFKEGQLLFVGTGSVPKVDLTIPRRSGELVEVMASNTKDEKIDEDDGFDDLPF